MHIIIGLALALGVAIMFSNRDGAIGLLKAVGSLAALCVLVPVLFVLLIQLGHH